MLEQKVENQSFRGWRGAVLVLGVALLVILGSGFFDWLGRFIGRAASVLFIAFGCAVAWLLLNTCVLAFLYECDGSRLRVSRLYGKRKRPMLEVWFNTLRACGSLEAMRQRFPGAPVQRAARRECPLAPLALAYDDGGRAAILLIQPDDRLRAAILKAVRG